MNDYSKHRSLDLFAGTGWGVAHQQIGVHEFGVELMPEAIETRRENGMNTVYKDVWDAHRAGSYSFDTLVASPPCQTFSLAGNGAGRKALSQVLSVIDEGWSTIEELREHALNMGDERIGLVLTPLHYAWVYQPQYIVLEQVPPVLPVWEAMAVKLREDGYSVWTGILNFEQYGVPQTRRRAILMARRDGQEAKPPTPTHSRYYNRDPKRLDEGVQKWVSMAEALGWAEGLVGFPRLSDGHESIPINGQEYRARDLRAVTEPSQTVTEKARSWKRFTQNNKLAHQANRLLVEPAPTITAGHDSGNRGFLDDEYTLTVARPDEIATLQSYPPFRWMGAKTKQFLMIGNAVSPVAARAILEATWGND